MHIELKRVIYRRIVVTTEGKVTWKATRLRSTL
jgi:hypothetical protein